ncbi:muts domain V-domain-containing protein [Filobasidium floriforme]|uniref:muts domain V-domain-containing protein n=1 Tax=Filobasidium floriforme TaxID=5210 RepID=UPI001E8D40AF|nr:muts domain V-domain-containing protein [Filobasidium floriforme]KAH8088295.1 muts domain V-domain-containing protein [Filobasidium floriforme]
MSSARAGSVRPSAGMENMGEWICAVFQSGGMGQEIGITSFDRTSGTLVDGQTFPRTLHHLFLHPPVTVLVPDNALASSLTSRPGARNYRSSNVAAKDEPSLLVQCIEAKTGIQCQAVPRAHWNRDEGFTKIQEYIVDDTQKAGVFMTVHSKYFAVSAASALYHHLSTVQGIGFAPGSQKIIYQAAEGTMFIDPDTAKNLELVCNAISPTSKSNLLGVMNRTQTKMGYRVLKASILQPSTVPNIIENRLDVIEELLHNDAMHNGLKTAIKSISAFDIDNLLAQLSRKVSRADAKADEQRLSLVLALRSITKAIDPLTESLKVAKSDLLVSAKEMLLDPSTKEIERLIDESINEEATAHPGRALNQKTLKIYAVRANTEPMLDVARGTYKENMEDIHTFKEEITEEYKLPFGLQYASDTGFKLSIKEEELSGPLPKGFRLMSKKNGKMFVTHEHLLKLNARMKDSEREAFLMSEEIVNKLIDDIVNHIACLYSISEAVGKLDMLLSFADISLFQKYVRPKFSTSLAIKGGKHPILDKMANFDCVPNDVYLSPGSHSFLLIQGANMAGKSTYLRQVALLVIMAMCGCYVPADFASIKIQDAVLTRLSNDDSIERSLSTFAQEMATSAMILGLATKDSLILIDELGRGTAPVEGAGICQAIAEELIRRKSFVLFATHFRELAETLGPFPGVDMLHLHSEVKKRSDRNQFATTYSYRVVKGEDTNDGHYGLELAKLAALPQDMLDVAEEVAYKLEEAQRKGHASSESRFAAIRRKLLLNLHAKLKKVVEISTLPDKELRIYLDSLRLETLSALKEAYLQHHRADEKAEAESEAQNQDDQEGEEDAKQQDSDSMDTSSDDEE